MKKSKWKTTYLEVPPLERARPWFDLISRLNSVIWTSPYLEGSPEINFCLLLITLSTCQFQYANLFTFFYLF